jgi:hypothetical protein
MTTAEFLANYTGDRERLATLADRVRSAGLGPVLAGLENQPPLAPLAAALAQVVAQERPGGDEGRLLARLVTGDADFARVATSVALAWLTDLAQAAAGPREE